MNAQQIVSLVNKKNIFLSIDNDKLVINAPKGKLTDDLKNLIKQNKSPIMEVVSYCGFTKARLKEFLGEDWELYANDEKSLQAWAHCLYERKLMEAGQIPPDFTAKAYCESCQQYVFLPPGLAEHNVILGCPWCLNKANGLPIPKADKYCSDQENIRYE